MWGFVLVVVSLRGCRRLWEVVGVVAVVWRSSEQLRTGFSAARKAVVSAGDVVVVTWEGHAEAVLVPVGMWEAVTGSAVDGVGEDEVVVFSASQVPLGLAKVRAALDGGVAVAVAAHGVVKAVFVPVGWAREMLPELGLPPEDVPQEEVLVVYRSRRRVAALAAEFAGAADVVWEGDRRLSAGPTVIPVRGRAGLVAVAFVEDGRVARVRAVDRAGEWTDVSGTVSLAPVGECLTAQQVEALLPGTGVVLGAERVAPPGVWREFLAV
ncbi:hypothetical protein [Nocardia tengchongensis]|uniref:hypothetical protein n=1 Tax=Nocardia tengchongensis TaxID=2055889 RepID=UPI0036B7DB00